MKYLNVFGIIFFSLSLVACGGGGGSDAGETSGVQAIDSGEEQEDSGEEQEDSGEEQEDSGEEQEDSGESQEDLSKNYNGITDYTKLDEAQCSLFKNTLFGESGYLIAAKEFNVGNYISEDVDGNGSFSGEFGGSVTVSSSFDSNNIGWVSVVFDSYSPYQNYMVDGTINFTQDRFEIEEQYHMVIDFVGFTTLYGEGYDVTVNGSMDIDRMHPENYVESNTLDLVIANNINDTQTAAEDLVVTTYDNNEHDISGIILVSEYGKVDVYNDGAVTYEYEEGYFAGAPMIAIGLESKCKFTPISSTQVSVELDSDNDDVYETSNIETWY